MQQKKWHPWALLTPALTAILFFLVIPVCFIVVYSFWLRAPSGAVIPAFQLGNYGRFFAEFFYPSILIRTIRVSLECVALCLVLGYIPAYFFYRSESRYKQIYLLLIMLPFWVSFIIRTMSLINIMGDSGLINHVLMRLGIISSPISMLYNEATVLMGLLMYLLPFMILNIYVSLEGIDKSLLEAARSMGCTEWQAFKEVTLPLSLPGVSAGCLLVFVLTAGTYVRLAQNQAIIDAFKSSLVLGSLTALISTTIGIMAAMAFVRYNFRAKNTLNTLLLSPIMIPEVVLGVALRVFMPPSTAPVLTALLTGAGILNNAWEWPKQ